QALAEVVQRLGFGDEIAPSLRPGFGSGNRASTPPPGPDAPSSGRSSSVPPLGEPRLLQLLRPGRDSYRPPPPPEPGRSPQPTLPEGELLEPLDRQSAPPPPPPGPLSPQVSDLIDEGFSALRAGDRDTARRCWSEALDLDPSNPMIELNLRRLDAIRG